MLKDKRIRWAIAAAAALAVIWFISMATRSGIAVKVHIASPGRVVPAVSVSGDIKGSTADLTPKVIGHIKWIGVGEGQRVSKGQVLAKLDNYDTALRDYESARSLFASGYATKQQLDLAQLQYNSSCFISPISGVVTLIANKTGESVSPGMVFISVVDPGSAYAEVQIDEADIGDVRAGQEVIIHVDAYPNESFNGTLVNIGQQAELKKVGGRIKMDEEDKIFRGRVRLGDTSGRLKIGMTISADIITERKQVAVMIPREAVFSKGDRQNVYVVRNRKAKETVVELGAKDATNIEIVKGLNPGESVAITGIDKLKNGARVKVEK